MEMLLGMFAYMGWFAFIYIGTTFLGACLLLVFLVGSARKVWRDAAVTTETRQAVVQDMAAEAAALYPAFKKMMDESHRKGEHRGD